MTIATFTPFLEEVNHSWRIDTLVSQSTPTP
jgi:hypothetical protein